MIGPGYFIEENDSTAQFVRHAEIDTRVIFNAGSEGSSAEGLYISDQVRVRTTDITIKNNRITGNAYIGLDLNNDEPSSAVYLNNYMNSLWVYNGGKGVVRNNIITKITSTSEGSELQIINNTFIDLNTGDLITVINSYIANNILTGRIKDGTGNTVENNFSNIEKIAYSANFIESESLDGKWQLNETSDFFTGATDGGQCGAFGGETPYHLSGLSLSVPYIYGIESSGAATESTGLKVTLKVRTAE